MDIEHYVAALLVIAAMNWAGGRFASRPANKLMFLATAGAPLVLCAGLLAVLAARDGVSTFQSPHFSPLLLLAGGSTIITSAAALIGQALGRPRSKPQV